MTPEREAEIDALVARCEAGLSREAEEKRDAVIFELERRADRRQRREWSRTIEVKGPGADTALVILGRVSTDPLHPTVDRQGDVLRPNLLRNAPSDRVPVSFWNHEYLYNKDAPAAGFASVTEVNGELRGRVVWNDTPEGRAAAQRVHQSKPDWSWGLADIETAPLTDTEIRAGAIRAIAKVTVVEVSPVDRAASVGSGTLACSCASCSVADGGKCAHSDGEIPPCHPRRRALDAEVARLLAHEAPKDETAWEPSDERRARLDDLADRLLEHEGMEMEEDEEDLFNSSWTPPRMPWGSRLQGGF
jgi:hypothetical protein